MRSSLKGKLIIIISWIVAITLITACSVHDKIPKDANPIIAKFAQEHNIAYSAYPESLIDLLERNPETESFVLQYPFLSNETNQSDLSAYAGSESVPLFLQWDTQWGYLNYGNNFAAITACGPVCLSMVAFYLTGDEQYAPDKMIEYANQNGFYSKGYGSSWTLISEGGKDLGFQVTELPLDKGTIFSRLLAGEPVICVVGPGDFTTSGHFLVFAGIEDGKIKVNDPNSKENSNKLWSYEQIKDQIKNIWSIKR